MRFFFGNVKNCLVDRKVFFLLFFKVSGVGVLELFIYVNCIMLKLGGNGFL